MKREQIIIIGLIVLGALAVAFLGREGGEPIVDGYQRMFKNLGEKKVVLLVGVEGMTRENKEYIAGLRRIADQSPQAAVVVAVDTTQPNERDAIGMLGLNNLPMLVVVGLNGKHEYVAHGPYDADKVAKGIQTGLTRPSEFIAPPEESDHEFGHSH